jgi:hypothetical protein
VNQALDRPEALAAVTLLAVGAIVGAAAAMSGLAVYVLGAATGLLAAGLIYGVATVRLLADRNALLEEVGHLGYELRKAKASSFAAAHEPTTRLPAITTERGKQ